MSSGTYKIIFYFFSSLKYEEKAQRIPKMTAMPLEDGQGFFSCTQLLKDDYLEQPKTKGVKSSDSLWHLIIWISNFALQSILGILVMPARIVARQLKTKTLNEDSQKLFKFLKYSYMLMFLQTRQQSLSKSYRQWMDPSNSIQQLQWNQIDLGSTVQQNKGKVSSKNSSFCKYLNLMLVKSMQQFMVLSYELDRKQDQN